MRKGRKVLACMMAAVTMMSLVGGCSSVPKETSGASGETVAASEAQKEAGFGETVTLRMWEAYRQRQALRLCVIILMNFIRIRASR